MAYEFKKLGEVEALESVPEGANALIETNGEIKRVPGSGLGGGGGIKTAILVLDTESMAAETQTATCSNMTYDEVKAIALAAQREANEAKKGNVVFIDTTNTNNFDSAVAAFEAGKTVMLTTDGIQSLPHGFEDKVIRAGSLYQDEKKGYFLTVTCLGYAYKVYVSWVETSDGTGTHSWIAKPLDTPLSISVRTSDDGYTVSPSGEEIKEAYKAGRTLVIYCPDGPGLYGRMKTTMQTQYVFGGRKYMIAASTAPI